MGISETIFWASYEREQSRQDRAMPARPRSALISEARRAAAMANECRGRRVDAAMLAQSRLERLRNDAPSLVGGLSLSRSAWKSAAAGGPEWLWEIEASSVRSQMLWILEHGIDAAISAINADVTSIVQAAEAAESAAVAMPEDAAAEAAYAAWERRSAAALDEIVTSYSEDGQR